MPYYHRSFSHIHPLPLSPSSSRHPITHTHVPIQSNSHQPSNLLLGGDGSWKLGDMGHALKADGSMPLLEEGDARYLDRCVL